MFRREDGRIKEMKEEAKKERKVMRVGSKTGDIKEKERTSGVTAVCEPIVWTVWHP
jgi:hypothetical protein